MNIVTGGVGFIGGYLTKLLEDTIVIDDLSHAYDPINIPILRYKLGSFSYTPKHINNIFHLAANISVKESMEHPSKVLKNNYFSTLEVAEWARKNDANIIFASSAAVYGPKKGYISIRDSTHPISVYGLSKLQGEQILEQYHKLYGINVIILRYANVYGPRQDPSTGAVIPTFIKRMLSNQKIYFYGDGSQKRDFIFVEDVAKITKQASKIKGFKIYNVGTGRAISIKQLFELMKHYIQYTDSPIFSKERVGDIKESVFDISDLFYKDFTPLEEGIKKTINYYNNSLLRGKKNL